MSNNVFLPTMTCPICLEQHPAIDDAIEEHMQQRHAEAWNTRNIEAEREVSLHSRYIGSLSLMSDN
jgi:hypothetical protein